MRSGSRVSPFSCGLAYRVECVGECDRERNPHKIRNQQAGCQTTDASKQHNRNPQQNNHDEGQIRSLEAKKRRRPGDV